MRPSKRWFHERSLSKIVPALRCGEKSEAESLQSITRNFSLKFRVWFLTSLFLSFALLLNIKKSRG